MCASSEDLSPEFLAQLEVLNAIVRERNQFLEVEYKRAAEWLAGYGSTSQPPERKCPPESLLTRCSDLLVSTHPLIAQQALGLWASLLAQFLDSKLVDARPEVYSRPLRFISAAMLALGKGTAIPVFEPSRVNGRHDTWNETATAKFKALCVLASDELLVAAKSETKKRLSRASADKLVCKVAQQAASENGMGRLTTATLKHWRELCRGNKGNSVQNHFRYQCLLAGLVRQKFGPVTSAEILLSKLVGDNAEKPLLFHRDQT
jgi:hypothetical protein